MKKSLYAVVTMVGLIAVSRPLRADLTLTAAGVADGFTLSEFASGIGPGGGCCGPLGTSINSLGQIIVDDSQIATNFVFNDVDGQTPATKVSSTSFGGFPPAFAFTKGSVWGSGGFSGPNAGQLIKFNDDGTINTAYSISGLTPTNGMWTNPVNGHLLASDESRGKILDIDVSGASPTFTVVTSVFVDGVTVSPDGKTVYGAVSGGIEGWDIATGSVVFPFLGTGSADGMGVISGGAFNGDIIVNQNDGTVVLVDPVTDAITTIASGGSRGDYTSPDTSNGTLFLTQSDSVWRLGCTGCSIGGPPPTVPEPASIFLLGTAGALIAWKFRRKAA